MFDCFKSTGDVVTEHRNITSFREVEVYDNVNVIFVQDHTCFLDVNAGENLLPLIGTEMNDGKLSVSNRNKCNWVRDYSIPIIVYAHTPRLRRVITYSSGRITSQGKLQCDTIEADNRGNGDIELDVCALEVYSKLVMGDNIFRGQADYVYVFNTSIGFAICSGLTAKWETIINKGNGNSFVNVSDDLDAYIESSGNIFYSGNPVIHKSVSGTGRLIHQ